MGGERLLITGTTGFLGRAILERLRAARPAWAADCEVLSPSRAAEPRCDLDDPDRLSHYVRELAPDRILHVAAESRMGACEQDPEGAMRRNAESTAALAEVGARILFVSTDLVFDGRSAPYRPADPVSPLSAYGASKAQGESAVVAGGGLVVRLPLLFGRSFDGRRGATDMLRAASEECRALSLFSNEFRTPLHIADAADRLLEAIASGRTGFEHCGGPERVSRSELATRFLGLHPIALEFQEVENRDASRPADVSLTTEVGCERSLDEMLRDA